jgi:hypothetical protein
VRITARFSFESSDDSGRLAEVNSFANRLESLMTTSRLDRWFPSRRRAVRWLFGLFLVFVLFELVVGGWAYCRSLNAEFTARTKLLLSKSVEPKLPTDEEISKHSELVKSAAVIKRAIERGELANLKSFENVDDVASAASAMISVERSVVSTSVNGAAELRQICILDLMCRGRVPDDCERVLNAVIQSYREAIAVDELGDGIEATQLMPTTAVRSR